ncbi:3-dehydroquinate synthase [Parafilimonas sp.]|uniref:3-dehydroquinate synthase n=1 Tax=Parafilimonas sp. TaxID=1969739 RepID=UPI0039E5DDA9
MKKAQANYLKQSFSVSFEYKVFFTSSLFRPSNNLFGKFIQDNREGAAQKILFVIDDKVVANHPQLLAQIAGYFKEHNAIQLINDMLIIPGGEQSKNDRQSFDRIVNAVNLHGIDRHSYLAAIGGGAVLDVAGYAAAVAHRGIRHIRIPTTVLSQNDSGIGVKNGINYFGKKNFLGTFVPPVAVFNDDVFLATLSDRDWRAGIAEAIKVALIKDAGFFGWIEENSYPLAHRNMEAMNHLIRRCAELHLEHIAGGDPFEKGSSRPLDFGHWSAHKTEQLSGFSILHGEAVAMGIALDTMYAALSGRLGLEKAKRVIQVLLHLGFEITHPVMDIEKADSPVLQGLNEFREHLGGQLTIMLLKDIGTGEEVHEIDTGLLIQAGEELKRLEQKAFPEKTLQRHDQQPAFYV